MQTTHFADVNICQQSAYLILPARYVNSCVSCVLSKETMYPMLATCNQLQSLGDLRDFVNETICNHEELEIDAFHMSERILTRGGEPCGLYFCIHGPRQVKFSAIWETDSNTILFYGSSGERFLKTRLINAPELAA